MAIDQAVATHRAVPFIPYDCYHESELSYGQKAGDRVSDLDLITGLDIHNDKLTAISACTDMSTFLITGITTTWGSWDSSTSTWTNVKRLNRLGKMSGLGEFDDNAALSSLGVTLDSAQDFELMQYWYQEASPAQE